MEITDVASSFLWREGRILLLHRSEGMDSFPDRWTVVSGRRDAGERLPETARREIGEETGYAADALRPLAAAAPFEVGEGKRTWRVHSFLWLLHDPGPVRLNRENVQARWLAPWEVARRDTVPRLVETLEGLLPPPGGEAVAAARILRRDRERGAAALAAEALERLAGDVPAWTHWPQVAAAAGALATARPAMAPLATAVRRWLDGRGPTEGPGEPPWVAPLGPRAKVELAEGLQEVRRALERAGEEAARRAAERLRGRPALAVFSDSSTVRRTLGALAPSRVLAGRSTPGGEGEALAAWLRERGWTVELLDDAEQRRRVGEVRAVLLGADALFPDGSVANKVGSRALARAARQAGVEVLVAADSFKERLAVEDFEPEEAEDGGPLFERVEAELLDGIVTERS